MADEGRFDVAKPESFGSKDNKEIDNDAIDLSDEQIQVLFEIVRNAESRPGPSNSIALFAAYDEIAGTLDSETHNKCFQFLVYMQRFAEDVSLYQRFERLLKSWNPDLQLRVSDGGESPRALEALEGNGQDGGEAAGHAFDSSEDRGAHGKDDIGQQSPEPLDSDDDDGEDTDRAAYLNEMADKFRRAHVLANAVYAMGGASSRAERQDPHEQHISNGHQIADSRLLPADFEYARKQAELEQLPEQPNAEHLIKDPTPPRSPSIEETRNRRLQDLEHAVIIARDTALLDKAFSHWATCAAEAVGMTALAKRHVLRKRTFDAWENITIINDLKVRRHILNKFFGIWRERYKTLDAYYAACDKAVERFDDLQNLRLVQRCWHLWFNARNFRNAHLFKWKSRIRRVFHLWKGKLQDVQQQARDAIIFKTGRDLHKPLNQWRNRFHSVQNLSGVAIEFRNRKLVSHCFQIWKAETPMLHLLFGFLKNTQRRAATQALRIWNVRAKQSLQAKEWHHSNMLRRMFSTWNYQLRLKVSETNINVRVLGEAMYKWLIAAKLKGTIRKSELKVERKFFEHWRAKAGQLSTALESAVQTLSESRRQRLLQHALGCCKTAMDKHHINEQVAMAYRSEQLFLFVMQKFREKTEQLDLMNRKADAARYYILTHGSIQKWQSSTIEHQRLRRREAYAMIRRNGKVTLATNCLNRLKEKYGRVRAMEQVATDHAEDKFLDSAVSHFARWKNKSKEYMQLEEQASAVYRDKLLLRTFQRIRDRHQMVRQMKQTAAGFNTSWSAVPALQCLHKLDKRLFQISMTEQSAQALRSRHLGNHTKAMIRWWLELTVHRRRVRLQLADDSGRGGVPENDDDDEDHDFDEDDKLPGDETIHRRVREWEETAFDNSNAPLDLGLYPKYGGLQEGFASAAATPGYMRTPSKRTAAREIVRDRLRALGATPAAAAATPDVRKSLRRAAGGGAFTAPARAQSILPGGEGGVSSFQSKMLAKGFVAPRGDTPGPAGRDRAGLGARKGKGKTPARRVDFSGFDDIPE